jgi:phenylacetate-CoA ligase
MSAIIDRLYLSLPERLQNLAISIAGYREYQLRYTARGIPSPIHTIPIVNRNSTTTQTFQEQRLSQIVQNAARNVPYYIKFFSDAGIDPKYVTLETYAEILPVVAKQDILANPNDFISVIHKKNSLRLHTSGTTGTPMVVYATRSARSMNYLRYALVLRKFGCEVRDRSATFAGRILFREPRDSIYWRKDHFNRTLYLSSYYLSDDTADKYLKALLDWQPLYIDAYPSAILELAQYLIKSERASGLSALRFILTSSETFSSDQRAIVKQAFGVPVIDHYGCTEMAVSAYSFETGRYDIDPAYCLVEVESGYNAEDLQGELICTSLINEAMPFLRYRIGDTVEFLEHNGSSGNSIHAFRAVIGRKDDVIVAHDGRRIGRMDPVFKGVSGICRAQIVQKEIGRLEVLVQLNPGATLDDVARALTTNINHRTGDGFAIEIRAIEKIPLDRNGKFRAVVSEIREK